MLLKERVVVIVRTKKPYKEMSVKAWCKKTHKALAKQYPIWCCPYHQGNPPPNSFEKWRHSFSSVMEDGGPVLLEE